MGLLKSWLISIYFAVSFQSQLLLSQNLTCNSKDFSALKGFMAELGAASTTLDSWITPNCCDWVGITCSSSSSRVVKLELPYKMLSGRLPESLGRLDNLKTLNLSLNFLQGRLPPSILYLPNLQVLDLHDNELSGQLTEGIIGNTSYLVHLDVSLNKLSGNFPDFFHSFPYLQYFSAHSNIFSGGIPPSLWSSRTISSLSLRNNSFNGLINFNCSVMSNLASLDLGSNEFHGPLPNDLPPCPKLKAINLSKNMITGNIPESFKNFTSLSFISFSNCSLSNLSSALKTLQHCPNLTTLILTKNFIGEELPSDSNLQFKELKVLIIANCKLSGNIPKWLNGSSKLQLLDLSWNNLTGNLPPSIGKFQSLFYADLSRNSLSGEIPVSITQLSSLISRLISPEELSLDFPFFSRRNLSAGGLQYNHVLSFPPTLDLSNNFLTGPIWPEFGNLKMLHILVLKCNNLSGNIPSSLGSMTSIETLDLSHNNNLQGSIPPSLVKLSFLSKFSVAYCNLSGEVPYKGQFPTFDNSSFDGNPGLCGEFYSPCQGNRKFVPDDAEAGFFIRMPVRLGYGTGFFLSVMLFLLMPAFRSMR